MPRRSLQSVDECYRCDNVRVFRLDRDATIRRLRERARALLDARPDVLEVRLFGSLARAEACPGSDADLFVIVRAGAPDPLARGADLSRYFSGTGIGCDVIVYTEAEYRSLLRRRSRFAAAVETESITLAARAADPEPSQRT
jgi:predicted nucleotidyltransferase